MIQVVEPINGLKTVEYECLYILVQGEYKFSLDQLRDGEAFQTERIIFTNTDISPQGRTDLVNFAMDFIAQNAIPSQ